MRLKRSNQGMIGIDITSSMVKLLELMPLARGYRIESCTLQPLPAGTMVERRILDVDAVVESVRNALEKADVAAVDACVAVPSGLTVLKRLSMSSCWTDEEIEARIPLEVGDDFPFPFNEVAFDFQVIPPVMDHDGRQTVLLAACRRLDVDRLADTVSQAGLRLQAVDVEPFAMARALSVPARKEGGEPQRCTALVDIGATTTTLHVLWDGLSLYSRDTPFGGHQLTESIRDHYQCGWEQAEAIKRHGRLTADELAQVVAPFLDTLVQHITRSLQLYEATGHHRDIGRLVLAGGGSVTPGLRERLVLHSDLDVAIANPLRSMSISDDHHWQWMMNASPMLLTACGLAMRSRT